MPDCLFYFSTKYVRLTNKIIMKASKSIFRLEKAYERNRRKKQTKQEH